MIITSGQSYFLGRELIVFFIMNFFIVVSVCIPVFGLGFVGWFAFFLQEVFRVGESHAFWHLNIASV